MDPILPDYPRLDGFRHGVHPDEHKEATAGLPIRRMPFVSTYVLPLNQHIGAPAKPVVAVGDRVVRGQLIALPGGFVSTALHAPVTGRVTAIALRRVPKGDMAQSIEIEADPFDPQIMPRGPKVDTETLTRDEFVKLVQAAGLVGLGGAAFPSHVKYALPEGRVVRHLLINGAECEPYLTCDHRTMVERPEEVLRGTRLLAAQLGVEDTVIGVEANKPDAIEALRGALRPGERITVQPLKVKYPQGAEKMLIKATYDLEVPAGKLPLDVGIVVNNVGTMASLADLVDAGQPLIERVVTVAGPGVVEPANLLVPVGTPVRAVLEHCGGLKHETKTLVMGGPMMGQPLSSVDVPILKGTSGLLAFTDGEGELPEELACVRCGRCLEACANFLNPSRLARLARAGRYEEMEKNFVFDCMECGGCSFACPSGIPIVQLIRVAKADLRRAQKKGS